jgi:endonuclease/exonuclease/phosphatase family metal-dependent hydrolase
MSVASSIATTSAPMQILSYNVWFDEIAIELRMRAIACLVEVHRPAALLLQEVTVLIQKTLEPWLNTLGYTTPCALGERPYGELIYIDTAQLNAINYIRIPFESSHMGRELQVVVVSRNVVTDDSSYFAFATSHLESLATNKAERKRQLVATWDILDSLQMPFIFGGDTNIGNKEVYNVPATMVDVWEFLGKNAQTQHTWDTTTNRNLGVPFASQCRFDRFYCSKQTIVPTAFQLVGTQHVAGTRYFPSDHWGILATIQK